MLTAELFKDAVLKAVNLGGNSDITSAVTGGLAGLRYGVEGLPKERLEVLARRDNIEDLAKRMTARLDP